MDSYAHFIGILLEVCGKVVRLDEEERDTYSFMFVPKFQITPALTKALMDIEASRQAVTDLPITVHVLTSLRESARLVSTHYSTQIEGNRLTQEQVEDVIHGGTFPNHEGDEREVKNYYLALDYLDTLIKAKSCNIAESDIQILHGLVMEGKPRPTLYRDDQNRYPH